MKKIYTLLLLIGIVLNGNAQIIYTDIPDVIVTGPSGTYMLDLDNGGQSDFTLEAFGSFATGYARIPSGSGGSPLNGIMESASAEVQNVSFGTSIGSGSSTWNPVVTDVVFIVYINSAFTTDFLSPNEMGYVGCRFTIGLDLHYGWARVMADNTKCELTIYDYAYESTPNTPILAGDQGISTAINDKELAFINVYNANRDLVINNPHNANLDLKVLNMAGQALKTDQFNYAINTIQLNSLASGVYVVSILNTDNNSYTHKKLLIK